MTSRAIGLVEVLIVISILLILAGIGFAVAGPARESARQSACINNIRQINVALQLYAADYPKALVGSTVTVPSSIGGALRPYGLTQAIMFCPDTPSAAREQWGSTYLWNIMLPPPSDDEAWNTRRKMKMAAMLEQAGDFVVVECAVHDEIYYQPRERNVDPTIIGAFLIRLRADGSVRKERADVPRSKMFGN